MAKCAASLPIAALSLNRSSAIPLRRQIYEDLRKAMLTGQLTAGSRLPSTRELAAEWKISRTTVKDAFEQLTAEGYLEGQVGSGTYVSRSLPDELLRVRTKVDKRSSRAQARLRSLSRRGETIAATQLTAIRSGIPPRPFRVASPATDEFPIQIWSRLLSRRLRGRTRELLERGESAGYLPLRELIAGYLRETRGVRCEADQIIIVGGSQHAFDFIARLLLDPGHDAWVETPSDRGARSALLAAGATLVPVPVDSEGLVVAAGKDRGRYARVVYVTPSHQYPLGMTMSVARRLELLDWARTSGAWIIEDDYDSEYRYTGWPLESLQGLDVNDRVIYVGTFTKVLFNSLRLGYVVAPPDLIDPFIAARAIAGYTSPTLEQAVLADFIAEGHFARHIRRMRSLYAERQAILVDELAKQLGGILEVQLPEGGMQLVAWLPAGVDDELASKCAALEGVEALPLSFYCMEPMPRGGLLLGFGSTTPGEIRRGVEKLSTGLAQIKIPR